MAKQKPIFNMTSFGIYTQWDERSSALPKLIEPTTDIPCREDIEFGFIVNVKQAKNEQLTFTIFHPDIPDSEGAIRPPFTDVIYVRNNNWDFYLGDTIWLPIENKVGHWRMTLEHNGKVIAEKTFIVELELRGERTIGQARSFFKPRKRW